MNNNLVFIFLQSNFSQKMFTKTQAIILNSVKYSDNSLILHTYTRKHSRMAFVVNGFKSKRCVIKPALQQPLSIVELEMEYQPKRDIQRIKESKIAYPFNNIPFDPVRNSIAFLLSEVLFRCLRETEENKTLFDFLTKSILFLDSAENGIANFHLIFLVKLTAFLGFYPNADQRTENTYFDLINGCFFRNKPTHTHFLSISDSDMLHELLCSELETMHLLSYPRQRKNAMLEQLMQYYSLHLSDFGHIKSFDILQTLFK